MSDKQSPRHASAREMGCHRRGSQSRVQQPSAQARAWPPANGRAPKRRFRACSVKEPLCSLRIEDADPSLIPAAIRNWQGLAPEERWWLYTMTNAATGHALTGRGRGWRKAIRFALTETRVGGETDRHREEFFSLVREAADEDV